MGSPTGVILSIIVATLVAPPIWSRLKAGGFQTYPVARWVTSIVLGTTAMVINGHAFSETPEGQAAEVERLTKVHASDTASSVANAKQAAITQQEMNSGDHCLSGWDGSFPELKDAVRQHLRNPRSFEHIETVRSPVDSHGKFGLIMTYRAENGFGGLNVEAIGIEVDAKSCKFTRASNSSLAKRLR